jgi:hypothetical protein
MDLDVSGPPTHRNWSAHPASRLEIKGFDMNLAGSLLLPNLTSRPDKTRVFHRTVTKQRRLKNCHKALFTKAFYRSHPIASRD